MDDLISRQAAIDSVRAGALSTATLYGRTEEGETARKEIERTIKALPSVNPQANNEDIHREREQAYMKGYEDASKRYRTEPCDDAISRTDAIRVASGYCHWTNIPDELAKLPSVNTKKTGRWIEHPETKTSAPEYLMFYECSECGDQQCFCKSDIHKRRFCSNCGCRMVEPQETETWNGIHAQITAPKGTFERIFNEADDNDI